MTCPICAQEHAEGPKDAPWHRIHGPLEIARKISNLEGQLTDAQQESRTWMREAVNARPIVNAVNDVLFGWEHRGKTEALLPWVTLNGIQKFLREAVQRKESLDSLPPRA